MQSADTLSSAAAKYLIVLAVIAAAAIGMLLLDSATVSALLSESGPVEAVTAVLLFGSALYALVRGGMAYARAYPYLLAIPLLMGLRELDFDRRFTTEGILTLRLYTGSAVPLHEKLVGAVVVALLIALIYTLVRRHLWPLLTKFRDNATINLGVVVVLGLCVVSVAMDGLPRRVSGLLGMTESALLAAYPVLGQSMIIEEVAENGIPVALIIMFAAWFSRQRVPPA